MNCEARQTNAHTVEFAFSFHPSRPTLRLRVTALQCGAVRVTRTLRDAFLPDPAIAVVRRDPGACRLSEQETCYLVDCGDLLLSVEKRRGGVTFSEKDGRLLLKEDAARPCVLDEKPVLVNHFRQDAAVQYTQSIDGVRASTADFETREERRAYTYRLNLSFSPDEALYGLGSHEEGYGNLRGKSRVLYQHNLKASVPVLMSTGGWGLLFDLGCLTAFHDDAEGSYFWAECADEMDYYFMAGDYEAVCGQYAWLTGHAPLLPKYAFGYVQSKERYKDAEELISIAREYRRRQVPLDVIVEDWQSWPEGQWGYKVFDKDRFPDPQALTDALHAMGVRMMISIWPSMQGERNENRKEMLENGCMLGNQTIYDAFSPKARALYWKQAQEGLFRYGVDAWWCDCSEPFESDWHGPIKPEPFERARINTQEAKTYLDPGSICLYSLYHARGIYEGQRESTSDKRVLNLTRSSWAGQHRYGTVTWSGDVCAAWEVLRRQVPEGLNFMATGEAYWTTDAGAFFPGAWDGVWFASGEFPQGVQDLGYRELYVRWLQFSAFLPMMRSHGTGTPREIWQFGEKGDPWYDAIADMIRLRSRMTPHWYSLAAAYSRQGVPMVRFPALAFPQDSALGMVDDEMLVGDSLLVKPVTRPMEYLPGGQKIEEPDLTEAVYLPEGTAWYAWESEEPIPGGQTVRVNAALSTVPRFVRAGGILLTGPVQQHVNEQKNPPLTVTVYPGRDGTFAWYDDAGDGSGCERGEYALVTFRWRDQAGEITVSAREGAFPGMEKQREMLLRLPGGNPVSIVYDGQETTVSLR